MAQYIFDVLHGGEVQRNEGHSLGSHDDARQMAQVFAGEVLKDGNLSVFEDGVRVRVSDLGGRTLFEILMNGTDSAADNDR